MDELVELIVLSIQLLMAVLITEHSQLKDLLIVRPNITQVRTASPAFSVKIFIHASPDDSIHFVPDVLISSMLLELFPQLIRASAGLKLLSAFGEVKYDVHKIQIL